MAPTPARPTGLLAVTNASGAVEVRCIVYRFGIEVLPDLSGAGHRTLCEASRYAAGADQERMARDAMDRLT